MEGLVSLEGENDGADGVGVGLDWGGGEGGGPWGRRWSIKVEVGK